MYEENGQGYTIYYADDSPRARKAKQEENGSNDNGSTSGSNIKSSAQRLRDDPNIEIVTKVPGLVWDIRYKVPPQEGKRPGVFSRIFKR